MPGLPPISESSSSMALDIDIDHQLLLQQERTNKIIKYEHFLNDVLRSDLKAVLERRDELYSEVSQYMELQTVMEKLNLEEEDTKITTRVDIGSNFYVQAKIPSTKQISVDIGCGIWLPMSAKDAVKFCDKKLASLNSRIDDFTEKELGIKAQIKLMLEGLRELQNLNVVEPKRRYEC